MRYHIAKNLVYTTQAGGRLVAVCLDKTIHYRKLHNSKNLRIIRITPRPRHLPAPVHPDRYPRMLT